MLETRDVWKHVGVICVVVYIKDICDDVLELCAEPIRSRCGCVILPTHLPHVGLGLFYVYVLRFFYILFVDECWIDRIQVTNKHESL